jgi:hypothetical protein
LWVGGHDAVMKFLSEQAASWVKHINNRLQNGYQLSVTRQPAKLGPLAECHEPQRGLKRPPAAQQHGPARRRAKSGTAVGAVDEGDDSDFDGAGGYDSGGYGEEQVCVPSGARAPQRSSTLSRLKEHLGTLLDRCMYALVAGYEE